MFPLLSEWKNGLFSTEETFLANLCRLSPCAPSEVDSSEDSPDAERLLSCILEEHLSSLLLWRMENPIPSTEPMWDKLQDMFSSDAWASIKEQDKLHRMDCLLRQREQANIEACLQEQNIPYLLYKGAAYSRLLYPKPHHRFMTDLDFLVAPSEFERAGQCLVRLGYNLAFQDKSYAQLFVHPTHRSHVDLHSSPGHPSQIQVSFDTLYTNSLPTPNGGRMGSLLDQTLLHIFHLCKHAFLPGFVRLAGFFELRELLLRLQEDDAALQKRARQFGLLHALRTSQWMLAQLYPGALPRDNNGNNMRIEYPLIAMLRSSFRNAETSPSLFQSTGRFLYLLHCIDSPKQRVFFVLRQLRRVLRM
ncbi:MAG: hypothetical protein EP343_14615 [Deltaproteobacteria bacterium]|nr:MAG: hypothetical protein EP343_14615 [Deltaproteobacteria bacterium]